MFEILMIATAVMSLASIALSISSMQLSRKVIARNTRPGGYRDH